MSFLNKNFFYNIKTIREFLVVQAVVTCGVILVCFACQTYHLLAAHSFNIRNLVGHDFVWFWTYADFLRNHDVIHTYSCADYKNAMSKYNVEMTMGCGGYPPHFFFLLWPLSLVNTYSQGYLLWLAINMVLFGIASLWKNPHGILPWGFILFSAPAILLDLSGGETSLLFATFIIGGFRLLSPAPMLAGMLFALASFKPQFGIVIPFVLLALKQYKAFASAVVSVLLLVLLSSLAFGWESWKACFYDLLSIASYHSESYPYGATISFYNVVQLLPLLLPIPYGYYLCAYFGIAAATLAFLCRRLSQIRQAHWTEWLKLTAPAIFILTPYGFIYDLCLLCAVWILWLMHQDENVPLGENAGLWLLAWYAPWMWSIPFLTHFYDYGLGVPLLLLAIFFQSVRASNPGNSVMESH